MPLPIIILLEGSWDPVTKETLIDAMPALRSLGYNMLCFEMPSDLSQQDILINLEHTLTIKEARFAEISAYLAKKGIKDNLLALEYTELKTLINLQPSHLLSNEIVLMIKALPGDRKKFRC